MESWLNWEQVHFWDPFPSTHFQSKNCCAPGIQSNYSWFHFPCFLTASWQTMRAQGSLVRGSQQLCTCYLGPWGFCTASLAPLALCLWVVHGQVGYLDGIFHNRGTFSFTFLAPEFLLFFLSLPEETTEFIGILDLLTLLWFSWSLVFCLYFLPQHRCHFV